MPALIKGFIILYVYSVLGWIDVNGHNCDLSVCPIKCSGLGCSPPGDDEVETTIASEDSTTCREVIIESIGYPHSYPDIDCEWRFDMSSLSAAVLRVIEFDCVSGDMFKVDKSTGSTGGVPDFVNVFDGDVDAIDALPSQSFIERLERIRITFTPASPAYHSRGFRVQISFSVTDATQDCSSDETIALTSALPATSIQSPNYPDNYVDTITTCYYQVTSPIDTQLIVEIFGIELREYEDYLYIYDISDNASPKLLRIFSVNNLPMAFFSFKSGTNAIQFVFQNNPGDNTNGFSAGITYEDIVPKCNGQGTNTDQCACSTVSGGPRCQVDGSTEYSVLRALTQDSDIPTAQQCGASQTITFTYDSANSNANLATGSYFSGPGSVTCQWDFVGEPTFKYALIISSFALAPGDTFEIVYNDGRDPNYLLRYSGTSLSLPITSDPTTFSLQDTPIILDSHLIRITYSGGNDAGNPGVLFEVHLLDAGNCAEPCFNGGECTASCTSCASGFQGEFCEQSEPPDYTCLVKNYYVPPHFAYPVQLHAIAGTNTFSEDKFTFDTYRYPNSQESLPRYASVTVKNYGNVLSLSAECDETSSSRFGVFSCLFAGDDFIDPVEIPAIVNPVSENITPIGRFTKTVSVNDATVTFSVDRLTQKGSLRWRFNNGARKMWNDQSTITLTDIQIDDDGIYECFIGGENEVAYDVVTYRLIVRACPDSMYDPPACEMNCPTCKNGGTCHDSYGTCICPPAYGGADCDELLTRDTIGGNIANTCPALGIASSRCKGILFCLPDPGGCMCMSGWTGSNCKQACPPLMFGLECQFPCHCDSDAQCDVATGACPGICTSPFSGPNCQDM